MIAWITKSLSVSVSATSSIGLHIPHFLTVLAPLIYTFILVFASDKHDKPTSPEIVRSATILLVDGSILYNVCMLICTTQAAQYTLWDTEQKFFLLPIVL